MVVKYTVSEFLSAKGSFSSIDATLCIHGQPVILYTNPANNVTRVILLLTAGVHALLIIRINRNTFVLRINLKKQCNN